MKIIKTYLPMILSDLFLMVYTILIVVMFADKTDSFNNSPIGLISILSVFAFLIEWVYFMINAAINKKVDNKGLWVFLIYMFNVFVIPYYNFKYNSDEKNLTNNMLIYIVASITSVIIGFVTAIYM